MIGGEGKRAGGDRQSSPVLYVRSDLDSILVPKLRENYSAIRFHEWRGRLPSLDAIYGS
jgi:hypothetical protein